MKFARIVFIGICVLIVAPLVAGLVMLGLEGLS